MNTPPETTTLDVKRTPSHSSVRQPPAKKHPLQIQALDGPSKVYVAYY
jgi:hypothetical protein